MTKLLKFIHRKVAIIPVSKQSSMIVNSCFFVSSDYISFYPSAMAHFDSNWPNAKTAKTISIEDSDRLCSLFNNGAWKNLIKSRFFKVGYYNPKKLYFNM